MTEPDESNWKIRMGWGLLYAAPLNESLRLAHQREDEREAKAAAFEAEQRRQATLERRQEMLMRGAVQHSVGEVVQSVSVAQDRMDRREAAAEARNAEMFGRGTPYKTQALLAEAREARHAKQAEEGPVAVVAGWRDQPGRRRAAVAWPVASVDRPGMTGRQRWRASHPRAKRTAVPVL